jgi:6-phosphogluconolactonase (cycloisomerase 2 family)
MKMQIRAVLVLTMAATMMALTGCDHYNCSSAANFGSSSCTSSGSGLGTSTGTGSATAAFVFVADATGDGTNGSIDGYTLNTSANTFTTTTGYTAPTTPLSDPGVGMVVAQSQFLYTAYGSTDQIFGWTIGSTGNLTAITGTPLAASFVQNMVSGFGTQSALANPAGSLLFFSDSLDDKIYVYTISSSGALAQASGSPVAVPFPPGNLATDGLGKYLYVTEVQSNHTGSQIAAYSIGTTGALTTVAGSPFAFPMWQLVGEPTGNYMIGTSGHSVEFNGSDDDNLYVFSITQTGSSEGALTELAATPTQLSPLQIVAQAETSGNLIYTFGLNDTATGFNAVEGYEIGSTGALTAASSSPFSLAAVGDQGALDQSGQFLFVYGGVLDTGTNTVTYQMGSFDVGSDGSLTEPTSTLTLTSGGFFVVTDPQQ